MVRPLAAKAPSGAAEFNARAPPLTTVTPRRPVGSQLPAALCHSGWSSATPPAPPRFVLGQICFDVEHGGGS